MSTTAETVRKEQAPHFSFETPIPPLHYHALHGQVEECRRLIQAGSDVNERTPTYRQTPLHCAAFNGNTELIKLLLTAGAEVRAVNTASHYPLEVARLNRHEDATRILSDAFFQLENNASLLHHYAKQGQVEECGELLERGADVNESTPTFRQTPLHCAAFNGNTELIRRLLEAGAKVTSKNKAGDTPLDTASLFGHVDAGKILVCALIRETKPYFNPSNINNVMYDARTALWWCCFCGDAEMVKWLLDHGAVVDAISGELIQSPLKEVIYTPLQAIQTPLQAAVLNGYREVVMELLSRGADVDALYEEGRTPLTVAILKDRADAGVALLDATVDMSKLKANLPQRQWVTNYSEVRKMEDRLDVFKSTPVLEQVSLARLNTFLDELNSWLEENPEHVSSYIQRARVLRRLNRLSEACVDYGCVFRLSNFGDDAEKAFRLAIKINSKNAIAYLERGNLLRTQNQLPAALVCYKLACDLDPNNVKALIKLGSVYRKAGEDELALDAYNKARGLDPNSIKAQSKCGWVLASLKRWSEASDAYKNVLLLDPARKSAHLNLIHVLLRLKRWSEAAEYCVKARAIFQNDGDLEGLYIKTQGMLEESLPTEAQADGSSCMFGL